MVAEMLLVMTQIQSESSRHMSELISAMAEQISVGGHRKNRLIDYRALGKPRDFSGKQVEWRE